MQEDAFGYGIGDNYCACMFSCFLNMINSALRVGGDIGDALVANYYIM